MNAVKGRDFTSLLSITHICTHYQIRKTFCILTKKKLYFYLEFLYFVCCRLQHFSPLDEYGKLFGLFFLKPVVIFCLCSDEGFVLLYNWEKILEYVMIMLCLSVFPFLSDRCTMVLFLEEGCKNFQSI